MTSVPLGADLTALGSYSARTQRALRVYFSRLRQAAIGRLQPIATGRKRPKADRRGNLSSVLLRAAATGSKGYGHTAGDFVPFVQAHFAFHCASQSVKGTVRGKILVDKRIINLIG